MSTKTIVILILSGLFLVLLIQNSEVVDIKFLFWKISMSRIILLPLILATGFIAGFFIGKIYKK